MVSRMEEVEERMKGTLKRMEQVLMVSDIYIILFPRFLLLLLHFWPFHWLQGVDTQVKEKQNKNGQREREEEEDEQRGAEGI